MSSGLTKKVSFAEPVVNEEIEPEARGPFKPGDAEAATASVSPDEPGESILGRSGRAMMPFGVRRPPASLRATDGSGACLGDVCSLDLVSEHFDQMDYFDVYPLRKTMRRVHIDTRNRDWIPTDQELPNEWCVGDLEDHLVTCRQYLDGTRETVKGKFVHLLEKDAEGRYVQKSTTKGSGKHWRGETWIFLKGADLTKPLESVHEPAERRTLEQGEVVVMAAGRQLGGPDFDAGSALQVERDELIKAQRSCRELKIYAEGKVIAARDGDEAVIILPGEDVEGTKGFLAQKGEYRRGPAGAREVRAV